jgi:hypothetical protein
MSLPEFWLESQGRLLIEMEESAGRPKCFLTRLLPKTTASLAGDTKRLRLCQVGLETTEVSGRRIAIEELAAPDGAVSVPVAAVKKLPDEPKKLLHIAMTAMFREWTTAFEGSPADGYVLANLLAGLLGLPFASYTVTRDTLSRDVLGDNMNPQTLRTTRLFQLLQHGGVFVVNVRELSPAVAKKLTMFTHFLKGFRYDLIHLGFPEDFNIHPDFHMVFNLSKARTPIPSELASNIQFIWTEPGCTGTSGQPFGYEELQAGPGTVLLLMKFNVPEYESWFSTVIEPVVRQHGKCIRIAKGLDEWRTEMRRAMHRADAVLVDVSHDLTDGLSVNVIWELTQLHREAKRLKKDRMLCFGRGLEAVPSRYDDPQFVWSNEVNRAWVPPVQRSLNIEDLLGFRIRKYSPSDPASVQSFCEWLTENLSVWVQGVTPPLTDDALRQRALTMLKQNEHDDFGEKWLQAIADQDVKGCWKLVKTHPPLVETLDLLGCLLSTVSVSKAYNEQGYWPLVKLAISNSETLRSHFFRLLQTKHLHQHHWVTNHFRENLWLSLRQAELSDEDVAQLKELAQLEADSDIRAVVESVITGLLPDAEQQEARLRAIRGFYGIEEPLD